MTTQPGPTSPALPPSLIAYLAQRDAQRADAVRTVLGSLTDRERALIKDAAVMGYVRGRMHPQDEKHPKDSAVLAEVVDACLAFPHLYPAINAAEQPPSADHATVYIDQDGDPWVEYLTSPRTDQVVPLAMASEQAVDRAELVGRIGALTRVGWCRQA
ncbi:hypothetical protein [Streptomyces antimycoticus]|uniref:hypothetical protein n=1 Tax=Streptomyces antimycoticus TaxID=68175 RepID=UPI000A39AE29|nr:hypothetical protein [Streptomyces antimycoticus]